MTEGAYFHITVLVPKNILEKETAKTRISKMRKGPLAHQAGFENRRVPRRCSHTFHFVENVMKAAIGNVQGGFVLAGNINAVNALLKQISDEDALADAAAQEAIEAGANPELADLLRAHCSS